MVFVSHANPEDNEVARWLALRLAREGYPVWCDLTKLLGGETFWNDIEVAIRQRTAKFIFLLSRASNEKPGTRNELDLALAVERSESIRDFVIPIRIDDLPFSDMNIQIRRKNAVDFTHGWGDGIGQLLAKLAKDAVTRDNRFDATAIGNWWRRAMQGRELVRNDTEMHISNWFPIGELPPILYVHELSPDSGVTSGWTLAQPAHAVKGRLISFAPATDFGPLVQSTQQLDRSHAMESMDYSLPFDSGVFRSAVTHLVRLAWLGALRAKQLPLYSLSQRRQAGYFHNGLYEGSRVSFKLADGFSGSRALCGSKSRPPGRDGEKRRRHWHYAISGEPAIGPLPHMSLRGHIVFSDDGRTPWEAPGRQHSARRSQGREWWNDAWRDRMLAAVSWIAVPDGCVHLLVSSSASILMSSTPMMMASSCGYSDDFARHATVDIEMARDEEED